MKSFILSVLLLFSFNLSAGEAEPTSDTLKVANVLVDNADTLVKVKAKNLSVVSYTTESLGQGKTRYVFKLDRTCFCLPTAGVLTVVQDMTPTYADGPIAYEVDLQIYE